MTKSGRLRSAEMVPSVKTPFDEELADEKMVLVSFGL
jgi:hypothetical protein